MATRKNTQKPPPKSAGTRTADTPLTDKEQQFVLHFTTTCNFTDPQKAIVMAGYAESRAHVQAYEVLARPNVAKAIEEARARVRAIAEEEAGFTLADVVKKIAEIAFFDPRKLYNATGGLLPPHEWPDDVTAAIAGVKSEELWSQGAEATPIGDVRNVKWIERTKALEMLMKHLGGYETDNKQKGEAGAGAIQELINVMRQVSGDACRLPIAAAHPG